jgi:TonB family protein
MSEAWKTWEGQTVDGFLLRQYLGGSNHSAVYLTQLNSSGAQDAAIKFIPADTNADAQLAKWRVAGELTHPHLLQLIRVGRCELSNANFLYVVMEYAEENLSQILPQRALEPEETRQVLVAVLNALGYLHGQKLAHSRIRPGNILAAGDQLKISSDTLAEIGSTPLSTPNQTIYDAPESATSPIYPAADVWSLGATLVEVLTQNPPVMRNHSQGELPIPEAVPAPFSEIARRSLQTDPSRRPSLKEVSAMLNPASPSLAPQHRESPAAIPTPEHPTVAVEPAKKTVATPAVARLPQTLLPATATGRASAPPAPRSKSRVAIPLLAVFLVVAAILAAPRMLNRFSQLQPHADTVQPTVDPAPSTLTPAPATTQPLANNDSPTPQKTPPQLGDPSMTPEQSAATRAADRAATRAAAKEAARQRNLKNSATVDSTLSSSAAPSRSTSASATATPDRSSNKYSAVSQPNPSRGAVLFQVVPDIPQRALDTIQGTVRANVKLRVDASGNVTSADLENNSSRFFGDQALKVAHRWTFTPPQVDGHNAPSEWILRFEFTPKATKVFPTQTNP